ncbi:MAG: right-handed parallel beta-helix repeat-containing protein [Acidobacteriota bacterium]|nr:right-handed parallel beta-helix repeat-containing protein [Acidobacteriota bacterium]MDH3528437.1 right-handed parallel beta-helix repeat-containing protein [Acidobacteriota bacterium]
MELIESMSKPFKPAWQKARDRRKLVRIAAFAAVLVVTGLAAGYLLIYGLNLPNWFSTAGDRHLASPSKTGKTINVKRGESFQKALDMALPGDTIRLEAGATFSGAFELPFKEGNQFITIRSAADDSRLPPPGKRLEPNKYALSLAKLESNEKGSPVIATQRGAHHYRFFGIEFLPTIEGYFNIVRIGNASETGIEDLPHHIEFDRVYIHGSERFGQRRGIAANGRHIRIVNSHISNIKRKGEETQAIAAWATDGPIVIENNYLEAAGMSILFGGADSPLRLTPTNCVVRNNRINKRPEWKGQGWVVKNFFEIKNGKNIKVQNNLMTNNWLMAQDGTAVLFTVREDSGEGAFIENIEFSNNIVRGSGSAVNILGSEGKGGRNLVIRNNIFDDINSEKWGGDGFFLKGTDWDGLVIENNTIIQTGNITSAYGKPISGLIFRNNIVFNNDYGFFGDDFGAGQRAVGRYFPGAQIENNVIIGGAASDYGRSNFYPASFAKLRLSGAGYALPPGSPYLRRGFGGGQVGANLDPGTVGGN